MRTQEKEWEKCKKDFIYFCKNYIFINSKDDGLVKFPIKKHQLSLLKSMNKNRFILGVLPRQCGKTVCSLAYAIYMAEFYNKTIFIGDNKLALLREKFYTLRDMIRYLPTWMKNVNEIKADTVERIVFKGGGRILGSSVDISHTRGTSIDILILDEFAYVSDERAESFISNMFPTISSQNGKVIILSTPNGKNHFYKMYKKSRKKELPFKAFKKTWKTTGGDPEIMTRMLKDWGKKSFDQQFMSKFV